VYGFVYDMPVRDICVFQEAILDGGISRLPEVTGMAFDVYLPLWDVAAGRATIQHEVAPYPLLKSS
jgi:hypothetical protein